MQWELHKPTEDARKDAVRIGKVIKERGTPRLFWLLLGSE